MMVDMFSAVKILIFTLFILETTADIGSKKIFYLDYLLLILLLVLLIIHPVKQ